MHNKNKKTTYTPNTEDTQFCVAITNRRINIVAELMLHTCLRDNARQFAVIDYLYRQVDVNANIQALLIAFLQNSIEILIKSKLTTVIT